MDFRTRFHSSRLSGRVKREPTTTSSDSGGQLVEQERQIGRSMRKVCVERQEILVAVGLGIAQSVDMGTADPELARAPEQLDPSIGRRKSLDDRSRLVRRIVVHHHDIGVQLQGQNLLKQLADVVGLLVRSE